MIIREISINDSQEYLNLRKKLKEESSYLLIEPDENILSLEEQSNILKKIISSINQTIIVIEHNNSLIAYASILGGVYRRVKHCAYISIGIRKDFQNIGLGTKLLEKVEQWSAKNDIKRLEIETVDWNLAAISLFKKSGFSFEGIKKNSFFINGVYHDELIMAKLL